MFAFEPSAVAVTCCVTCGPLQTLAIVQAIGESDGERRQREMHHVRAATQHSRHWLALTAAAPGGPRSALLAGFLSHERRHRAARCSPPWCSALRWPVRCMTCDAHSPAGAPGALLPAGGWKAPAVRAGLEGASAPRTRTRCVTLARTRLQLRGSQGLVRAAGTRYEAARACVWRVCVGDGS